MTEPQGGPGDFEAMDSAAKKAEHEFKANPVTVEVGHGSLIQNAADAHAEQLRLTHAANRRMRFIAFVGIGAFVSLFLLALLAALCRLLSLDSLTVVLGLSSNYQWHSLVFVSVLVAVFAAIPLSLAMALVKMISEKDGHGDGGDLKTPSTELGKVILDLLKSVISAAKN